MKPPPRVVVTLLALLSFVASAQSRVVFKAASIKLSPWEARENSVDPGAGQVLTVKNLPLREMIKLAWGVQTSQILGGPAWVDLVRYDIVARSRSKAQPAELLLMLRSLLEDRFRLTIHRETKELPVFSLVPARKDGKLGPGIAETKEGACTPPPDLSKYTLPKRGDVIKFCGSMFAGASGLTALSVSIPQLVPELSRLLGRTVIDKTGLTGNFDINVEWTVDETAPPGSAPSIFTVFPEKFGIKLDSQVAPVEVLIIDSADYPVEN